MEVTFPHPGDQHLKLCLGKLNGEWVVSTLNTQNGGHCHGHYFGRGDNAELEANAYYYRRLSELCAKRAADFAKVADSMDAAVKEAA